MMLEQNKQKGPEPNTACPHLNVAVTIGIIRYLEERHRVVFDPATDSPTWTKLRDRDPGNKDAKWIVNTTCIDCGRAVDIDPPPGEEFE